MKSRISSSYTDIRQSRHPEEGATTESGDESSIDQDDLVVVPLESNTPASNLHGNIEDFAALLPPAQHLTAFWEAFVERVDPLTKILHLPTFQSSLTDAIRDPRKVSRSLRALILAFCLIVVTSLGEEECEDMLHKPKDIIFTKYRLATRRALIRAGLLDTSNPETLQAYAIFVVSHKS